MVPWPVVLTPGRQTSRTDVARIVSSQLLQEVPTGRKTGGFNGVLDDMG